MSKAKKIIVVEFKHNVNDTLHLHMPHKNIPIVKMQGSLDHEAPTDLQKSIEKINKSTEAINAVYEIAKQLTFNWKNRFFGNKTTSEN